MLDHRCQHYLVFPWWITQCVMRPRDGTVDFTLLKRVEFDSQTEVPCRRVTLLFSLSEHDGKLSPTPSVRTQSTVVSQWEGSTALLSQTAGYGPNLCSKICFQLFCVSRKTKCPSSKPKGSHKPGARSWKWPIELTCFLYLWVEISWQVATYTWGPFKRVFSHD